ncbi:carbohydrate ABC transporter permease [Actinomadura harenae]|uniref:carbohydrate ABC transporter permease n=1 Tax=Actinomadura harenae TaxID=2483351 RepID=UPI0011C45BDA|nr:sugar ABC transporter permease [Actinomadura harenae]
MSRRPRAAARRSRADRRTWGLAYLFVAPTVLLTVVFSIVPLVMLGWRSLHKGNVFGTSLRFVGLRNYKDMLAEGGGRTLGVTAEYTVAFVLLTMLLGLGLALLLNARVPGTRRLRAPFIIPLVVPAVATALIWSNLFAPRFGLVNRLLSGLGLDEVDFMSRPGPALAMVVLFGTWQFFGQNVILYLAALKTLPQDVMEAASVDGAGGWQRFRHMQWPMLRRNTLLILVVTTLTGLQTFTQIYVLTSGGPDGATRTALYYVYDDGFAKFDAGRADAMGMLLFLISLVVTGLQIAMLGRRDDRA